MTSRPRRTLLVILGVALVVRIVAVLATSDYVPVFDSGDYDRHAQSIAAGDGYPETIIGSAEGPSAFRPPLYPYVLGGVYAIVGNEAGVEAGRVLGALIGVVTVGLIFLLARQIGGNRAGLVAAGLAAIFPPLALIHLALISEPFFLALEIGAFLFVLAARRDGGLRWAAAAGALCGLAALTRGNGVILVIVAALAVWPAGARFSWRGLAAPFAVALAAAAVVLPWTVRNAIVFDDLVPVSTQNGYGMAGAFNDQARKESESPATWIPPELTDRYKTLLSRDDLNEAELDSLLRSRSLEYFVNNPGEDLEAIALNSLRISGIASLGSEQMLGDQRQLGLGPTSYALVRWSFLVIAAAALVSLIYLHRRARGLRPPPFILFGPILLVISAVWILGNTRYRVPLDPIILIVLALGLTAWLDSRRPEEAPEID
jgi:hypothetical protein